MLGKSGDRRSGDRYGKHFYTCAEARELDSMMVGPKGGKIREELLLLDSCR